MAATHRIAALSRELRDIPSAVRAAGGVRAWLLYEPGPVPQALSWARKRWVRFLNPRARIHFVEPVYVGPGFAVEAPHGGSLTVGPGCALRRGVRVELAGPSARVDIGEHTVLTGAVLIQCASVIRIGRRCQLDQDVLLVDGTHRLRDPESGDARRGLDAARRPLTIADHVTVMAKCTVSADIDARTVVGANSVVLKPLPARCLAAGSPAEVLGYFDA
jgi:acetyltransferase-like isoleucine patch superfamily enzyme